MQITWTFEVYTMHFSRCTLAILLTSGLVAILTLHDWQYMATFVHNHNNRFIQLGYYLLNVDLKLFSLPEAQTQIPKFSLL